MDQLEVHRIDGLPATAPERTVFDLARFCRLDEIELALEAMLRGPDPRRPRDWHADRWDRFASLVGAPHPGNGWVGPLRRLVAGRGAIVPTGSGAETRMWQVLRFAGLSDGLVRQPSIRFVDPVGRVETTLYPDQGYLPRAILLEADGAAGHSTADQLRRDARRQNELSHIFQVLRFRGSDIRSDPASVVRSVTKALENSPELGATGWRTNRYEVILDAEGAVVRERR